MTPPMGPPAQLKEKAFLIGTWDAVGKGLMDPSKPDQWSPMTGVCEYRYTADGAAIQMDYESNMMGMPYRGLGLQTYDRETNQWQLAWVDNMSARLALFTGEDRGDNSTVVTGEGRFGGMVMQTRMSSYNETKNSFDWKFEQSFDGGKSFITMMLFEYKKRGEGHDDPA